jgi:hypothetical protein
MNGQYVCALILAVLLALILTFQDAHHANPLPLMRGFTAFL